MRNRKVRTLDDGIITYYILEFSWQTYVESKVRLMSSSHLDNAAKMYDCAIAEFAKHLHNFNEKRDFNP